MSETANIHFPSVRPKQPPRRQKSPKKKQTIVKNDSKRNRSKGKHESAKAPCKNLPHPDEIINLNKKKTLPVNSNVASTRIQKKEIDYRPIYFDQLGFETPKTNNMRTHLYLLMTCQWCHKLFNFERTPRIEEGITMCSFCINDVAAKDSSPMNLYYISAVNRIHQTLMAFKSETPYSNDLERAISNKNSFAYTRRLPAGDLDQKFYQLNRITSNKNHLIKKNAGKYYVLFCKIGAVDRFKSNLMRRQPLGGDLEIFENLKEYGNLLLTKPYEENGALMSWEGFASRHLSPFPIVFTKMTIFNLITGDLELYFYVDIEGKRLYTSVCCTSRRVYIESFKPKLPHITSVGIATFLRLDDDLLPTINVAYFDISPEKDSLSSQYCTKCLRCYLILGLLDNSWQTAKLFLGSKNASYLGAEIEVTEEKVIFNHYMKDGKPMTDNIENPILWDYWHVPSFVHQGMIVSHSVENINKLTIYKHDKPTKLVNLIVGFVEQTSYGALMKIPLGKHKIYASGIGIDFRDETENDFNLG